MREIPEELIEHPSIDRGKKKKYINLRSYLPGWINSSNILSMGNSQEDKNEARKLRLRAARYALIDGKLYRRSFYGPYLKCLRPDEAESVMGIVHSGVCGNHSGGKSLAHKVMREGYYWPSMMKDAINYAREM